ncbi:MAG: nitrate/nitrite transporter NrtS [Bacteroidota bacterium]
MEALRGNNLIGTIKIAIVVGSILCLINQSHLLLDASMTPSDYVRLFLNYMVPFSVATYSKMQLFRNQT